MKSLWAIILAAGKGKRMKLSGINKVAVPVKGIPMILLGINILRKAGVANIVVVVGHAKESVLKLLDSSIDVVEQKKRLGTGHAVKVALKKIPESVSNIMVLNGDDAFFLTEKILQKLYSTHRRCDAVCTFLTTKLSDPTGFGRVVRENGKAVGIIEEKDANSIQKKVKEVNAACYIFDHKFIAENINRIKKSKESGEYYVVSLVDLACRQNKNIETVSIAGLQWKGVNTPEDLAAAKKIMSN